jgi:hypothetical protein
MSERGRAQIPFFSTESIPPSPAVMYSSGVRRVIKIAMLAPALVVAAHGQTSGKAEFEVESIKSNPPQPGFHFAADSASGGPGINQLSGRGLSLWLSMIILRTIGLSFHYLSVLGKTASSAGFARSPKTFIAATLLLVMPTSLRAAL